MSETTCGKCGGTHYGSRECPYLCERCTFNTEPCETPDCPRNARWLAAPGGQQGKEDALPSTAEDANNYCRILTLLGMEEEGDPVAEVASLLEANRMTADHARLAKFYGVTTYAGLVQAQAHHVEKLQAKLPATPNVFAPQRVREG